MNQQLPLNILSMTKVRKHFRVAINTDIESSLNVHVKDGQVLKFKEVELVLYIFCSKVMDKHIKDKVSGYCFLTLLSANKSNSTLREVKLADRSRALYQILRLGNLWEMLRGKQISEGGDSLCNVCTNGIRGRWANEDVSLKSLRKTITYLLIMGCQISMCRVP